MNDKTKRLIAWAVIVAAIVAAAFLGVRYPIPEPPDESLSLRVTALEQAGIVDFSASGSGEGYSNFTSIAASEDLYVGDDATVVGDLDAASITTSNLVSQSVGFNATSNTTLVTTTVTGPLTVSGAGVISGTSTLVGNVTLSALLKPGFSNETITNGETLTPTVTVYALDSAGAVTMTLAASASEGQLLILIGDDNYTITVADTNLRSHDGAAMAIGQYDTATFIYQDSEWIELSESANQ